MKYIQKSNPISLQNWIRQNQSIPQNLNYINIPSNVKQDLQNSLLIEQGYICAYTMVRIHTFDVVTNHRAHIEHFFSQKTFPIQTHHYNNMFACLWVDNKEFGATYKDEHNCKITPIINPTNSGCEHQFEFTQSGKINGKTTLAQKTIEVLNLNNDILIRLRRKTLEKERIVFPVGRSPKNKFLLNNMRNKNEALLLSKTILSKDISGYFPEFCVAIFQVAQNYGLS